MKNQSTRKLEKDLLKLHTKNFTDTDKLTILHLILDGKIADTKDMLKPQDVPEKEIDNIIQEYKKNKKIIKFSNQKENLQIHQLRKSREKI